jgi:hypothetical protein
VRYAPILVKLPHFAFFPACVQPIRTRPRQSAAGVAFARVAEARYQFF